MKKIFHLIEYLCCLPACFGLRQIGNKDIDFIFYGQDIDNRRKRFDRKEIDKTLIG